MKENSKQSLPCLAATGELLCFPYSKHVATGSSHFHLENRFHPYNSRNEKKLDYFIHEHWHLIFHTIKAFFKFAISFFDKQSNISFCSSDSTTFNFFSSVITSFYSNFQQVWQKNNFILLENSVNAPHLLRACP